MAYARLEDRATVCAWCLDRKLGRGKIYSKFSRKLSRNACACTCTHYLAQLERHPHVTCWFEQQKWGLFLDMIDIIVKIITNNQNTNEECYIYGTFVLQRPYCSTMVRQLMPRTHNGIRKVFDKQTQSIDKAYVMLEK